VAAGSKQRLGKKGPLVNVDSHMLKAWQILQTFVFPTTVAEAGLNSLPYSGAQ